MGAAAYALKEQGDYQVAIGEARVAIEVAERGPADVISMMTPHVQRGIAAGNRLLDALHSFLQSRPSAETLQLIRSATEASRLGTEGIVDLGARVLQARPHYWTVAMQAAYENQLEELESLIETFDLTLNTSFQAELARRIDAAEANGVVDDESGD